MVLRHHEATFAISPTDRLNVTSEALLACLAGTSTVCLLSASTSTIRRAADLRICAEFLNNDHLDVDSASAKSIREIADFGVTHCV